jgi:hypothetical protein
LFAITPDDFVTPLRVLEGSGTDIDPGRASGQRGLETPSISDTTRNLNVNVQLLNDAADDLRIGSMSEGSIKVNQVNPLGSQALPLLSDIERVAKCPFRTGHPLLQLDGTTALDINGWKQREFSGHRIRLSTQLIQPACEQSETCCPRLFRMELRGRHRTILCGCDKGGSLMGRSGEVVVRSGNDHTIGMDEVEPLLHALK